MICGIGIDLVEIARLETLLARWSKRFLERVYTPEEIAAAEGRADRAVRLAARFAAKEALAKALGTGVDGNFSWKDFAVRNQADGCPQPVLSARLAERLKGVKIHLSLSHTEQYAVAVVVLEKSGTYE
ncbi:MAG: holo-ACP synthase [candidate division KSB1 bacterium]|nr:holo-ACP synthase [candidate division KSB1 bacterium]